MRIVVLGSTGATGRQVLSVALDRGHEVVALARRPAALDDFRHERLEVRQADVTELDSVTSASKGADALVSALGISSGGPVHTLSAGARAVVAAEVPRVAWMGSFGAGESRHRAGALYDVILRRVLGEGFADKAAADAIIAGPSVTVFHPGMLTARPPTGRARVVPLEQFDRSFRLMPSRVARADVAAALVQEIEIPAYAGRTVVIL